MRKLLSIIIVVLVCYFVSCSANVDNLVAEDMSLKKNGYEVSIPQAIEKLNAIFPGSINTTRTSHLEVTTLTLNDFGLVTRSSIKQSASPLIYIIPTDNNGCAIMSADKRMPSLYALLENTTISDVDILGGGTRSKSEKNSGDEDITKFVSSLLNNAILNDALMIGDNDTTPDEGPIQGSGIETTLDSLPPLLRTKWHQNRPYTIYSNPPIKCGPIALAQIIYYHRQPDTIRITPYRYIVPNWDLIGLSEVDKCYQTPVLDGLQRVSYYVPKNTAGNSAIAEFVYYVMQSMQPSSTGGTTIYKARNALINLGYSDVNIISSKDVNYSLVGGNIVIQKLNNKLPLYASASTLQDTTVGHAWVIDGYKNRGFYTINENGAPIYDNIVNCYLHCNYGWSGHCDGYYYNKIFDALDQRFGAYLEEDYGDISISKDMSFNPNQTYFMFYNK